GFRLHDVARHHLAADFRRRDPSGFERVRRRAVDFLLQRLDTAPRSQRHGIAATLLNVCADALPSAATYADLSISGNLVVQMANERYLPGIQRLLRGAGTQPILFDNPESYPRLMNRIVAEAPEWCRIVFDSEGQVVGFFVAVLLYRDSIALIEDIEPDAVRLHLPEEYDHFARLSADEADTYLAVMVAAEENHPEYRGGELMGVIIRDGLARLGDGTRAILRTNRSDLEELLRMLGFTRYYPPESEEAKADPRRSRFQLDVRHGRFGPWVLSLLAAMARKPAPTRPVREFTVDDVRALLTDAHDADAWAASPVPRSVGIPAEELRAKVKHFLSGREPCPPPLTEYDAELLYKTYWRRIAADAVAAELHISRATYYRHLRRATERLQQPLASIAERLAPEEKMWLRATAPPDRCRSPHLPLPRCHEPLRHRPFPLARSARAVVCAGVPHRTPDRKIGAASTCRVHQRRRPDAVGLTTVSRSLRPGPVRLNRSLRVSARPVAAEPRLPLEPERSHSPLVNGSKGKQPGGHDGHVVARKPVRPGLNPLEKLRRRLTGVAGLQAPQRPGQRLRLVRADGPGLQRPVRHHDDGIARMEPVLDDGRLHGLQNADGQAVGPHHVHVGGAADIRGRRARFQQLHGAVTQIERAHVQRGEAL